jgi:hypothetical protein
MLFWLQVAGLHCAVAMRGAKTKASAAAISRRCTCPLCDEKPPFGQISHASGVG